MHAAKYRAAHSLTSLTPAQLGPIRQLQLWWELCTKLKVSAHKRMDLYYGWGSGVSEKFASSEKQQKRPMNNKQMVYDGRHTEKVRNI